VRQAFGAYLPQALVEGIDVASGVAEQPVGYEEIGRGARNRARAALSRGGGDLAVGVSVGNVGRLTLGVLPRAEYTRHAVLCALVRFLHPGFYFTEEVR
jgi:non-canonical (house-cleaning) NTP pyrophosphatase